MKRPDVVWDWDRFFRCSIQTVLGVASLHNWKPPILHRDVKSLNFLVDRFWNIKVADLGSVFVLLFVFACFCSKEEKKLTVWHELRFVFDISFWLSFFFSHSVSLQEDTNDATLKSLRGTFHYSPPEVYRLEGSRVSHPRVFNTNFFFFQQQRRVFHRQI